MAFCRQQKRTRISTNKVNPAVPPWRGWATLPASWLCSVCSLYNWRLSCRKLHFSCGFGHFYCIIKYRHSSCWVRVSVTHHDNHAGCHRNCHSWHTSLTVWKHQAQNESQSFISLVNNWRESRQLHTGDWTWRQRERKAASLHTTQAEWRSA